MGGKRDPSSCVGTNLQCRTLLSDTSGPVLSTPLLRKKQVSSVVVTTVLGSYPVPVSSRQGDSEVRRRPRVISGILELESRL